MIILMEEQHKTLEYQETIKVDVENITKTNGYQYMKLLILHFFQKQTRFTRNFRLMYKKSNEPQFLTYEVKVALKKIAIGKGLYAQVLMIFRKNSDIKEGKKNTNKYNFRGQSERT